MLKRFLASQISGWMALGLLAITIAGGGLFTKFIYDYQQLKVRAAYCDGQESMVDFTQSLTDRAIDHVLEGTEDTIQILKEERDEAKEQADSTKPDGCAAQRAPDSILRHHGWVSDDKAQAG